MTERIIILGAGGDLTRRYLLPALAELEAASKLSASLQIIGAGRADHDDGHFARLCRDSLAAHGPELSDEHAERLGKRLGWRRVDAAEAEDLAAVLAESPDPAVLYLALPPSTYPAVLAALQEVELPAGTRLVLEKPFGTDQDSARDLNRRIGSMLPEDAVFRVDHFLAKQTVQNIVGLRFANRIFEPVWNHFHVARVEITWDETLGLEGRAGYYDQTGALRDMLQNHLLQLLALVAMEPPASLEPQDLRDRKVDVLRATRPMEDADGMPVSVRARYTAGEIDGSSVPDYVDEEGVDPDNETETFAMVTCTVDNWRWAGVPFVLRSGKALGADRAEVRLHFQEVPHSPFPPGNPPVPNVLRLDLGPDRIDIAVNFNDGGDLAGLAPAKLAVDLAPQDLPAYARLLLDVLDGDPTLSIRGDEAEECWRIVEPVLASWRRGDVPLRTYQAGSTGQDLSG